MQFFLLPFPCPSIDLGQGPEIDADQGLGPMVGIAIEGKEVAAVTVEVAGAGAETVTLGETGVAEETEVVSAVVAETAEIVVGARAETGETEVQVVERMKKNLDIEVEKEKVKTEKNLKLMTVKGGSVWTVEVIEVRIKRGKMSEGAPVLRRG